MRASDFKALKIEQTEGILTVTFNRPHIMNALDEEARGELDTLFTILGQASDVKAVILTGEGKAFSAGGDLNNMKKRYELPLPAKSEDLRKTFKEATRLIDLILNVPMPIISAVNGVASGLGATIALSSDIIIASDKAKFNDSHIKAGIVPGDGGCLIWPLLMGVTRAKYYLMTGDLIDAREAERMGIITKVVPHGELMSASMDIARKLSNGPTLAISWTKRAINKVIKQNANLIMDTSLAWEEMSFLTEDHGEAINAFLEKREPKFKGA
jgi:enoyl-CoA hydratase